MIDLRLSTLFVKVEIQLTYFTLQIETYAYHLPHASLANLVDIFISLSVLDDSLYNLCHLDDFKFLADMIEHIKLPLKAKFVF